MSPLSLARALYDDGCYRESIVESRRVLGTAVDNTIRLRALLLTANSYWALGEHEAAWGELAEAAPLVETVAPEWRGRFYGTRAVVYRKAGKYDEAAIDYEAARYYAAESGDRECEARALNNIAKLNSDLGRYGEAIDQVNRAIKLATELNETILVGEFYDLKAQIHLDHGEYEKALRSGCEALKRLRGHPSSEEAQQTHARALNAAVSMYTSETDPVRRCNLRRVIVNGLNMPLDSEIIRMALSRSDGHIYKAAKLLNVKHQSLEPLIEENGISRRPKRRRGKRLNTKIK